MQDLNIIKDSTKSILREIKKMHFKIFKNLEPDLENLWEIFEEKSNHTFFQNLFFLKKIAALKHQNHYFIVIYDKDRVIGIFPLEIKKIFGVKVLQWIGTKYADYCCPLISKEYQISSLVFKDLWANIINEIDCDIVILDKQPEFINNLENPFVNFLKNLKVSKVFLIDLPDQEDKYFKNIQNKKFFNEFKRTSKKVIEKYDLKFENIKMSGKSFKPSDLIKQKISILDKKFLGKSIEENFINFFDNMIFDFPDQIKLSVLKINKEIVSANLGFLKKDRFYYYMPVLFTNNYNKYSPGKILISELIKWSIANKVKIFDFGVGEENYKKYWSNRSENLYRHLYSKNFKGLIALKIISIYLYFKNFL